MSSTATRLFGERISLGPEGQLVLITGVPSAKASEMTRTNPSYLDERISA